MVDFFEPEDEYKVDEGNQKSTKTKLIFVIALISLGLLLNIAIQGNFVNFFGNDKLEENCTQSNSFFREEGELHWLSNSKKALKDHLANIKELDGFVGADIGFDENRKDVKVPVINFIFKKGAKSRNRVPKTLCGFDVIISIDN